MRLRSLFGHTHTLTERHPSQSWDLDEMPKAVAAKNAPPKRKATPKAAAAEESTTLDATKSDQVRRRQLSRRNTDGQIERALAGPHLKHISEVTLANRLIAGQSVREALREKIHSLAPGQRLGSTAYAAIARLYSAGESSVENFRPSDPTQPLNEELLRLLFAVDGEQGIGKAHKALASMLETCAEMNEKNIGLVKSVLNNRVLAKGSSEHMAVAIMRYFARQLCGRVLTSREGARAQADGF